jgi:hypothetical protein
MLGRDTNFPTDYRAVLPWGPGCIFLITIPYVNSQPNNTFDIKYQRGEKRDIRTNAEYRHLRWSLLSQLITILCPRNGGSNYPKRDRLSSAELSWRTGTAP